MNKSVGERTRKGIYWNSFLKVPYEVFHLGISIAVARILEPKDFGIVSIATMAVVYANSISNLGFNQALIQRSHIDKRHIDVVFTFDLSISIMLTIAFFCFAPMLAQFFNSHETTAVVRTLSIIFVLTTLHDLPYSLLRRDIDFRTISIINITRELLMSLITLVLAIFGYKYWSLVYGRLVPLILTTSYLAHKMDRYPRIRLSFDPLRELFSFGIWSVISSQINFLSSRIDRIIIGGAFDTSILGLYDKAKSLSQLPSDSVASNINTVMFSSFSRIQHNKEELIQLLSKGLVTLTVITFPIFLGLYGIATHFVTVLFGDKWRPMIDAMQILCICGLFTSMNGLLHAFLVSTGKYRSCTIRLTILTCLLCIGIVGLVEFGMKTVALTVLVFYMLLFFLNLLSIKRNYAIEWQTLGVLLCPATSVSLGMLGVLKMASLYVFEKEEFGNLAFLVLMGSLVYAVGIFLFPSRVLDEIRTSVYADVRKVMLICQGLLYKKSGPAFTVSDSLTGTNHVDDKGNNDLKG